MADWGWRAVAAGFDAGRVNLEELLERQRGILTRSDAARYGLDDEKIGRLVRSGRWQRLHLGVFASFSGLPGREAVLWAAVLRAGRGAVISHGTAAELLRLVDEAGPVIHVTVPVGRHPQSIRGVRVHLSRRAAVAVHPAALPPRTRVEETVLDLADAAASVDDACGWAFRAIGRRLTTAGRLHAALDERPRARWRRDMTAVLSDVSAGVHSILEHRYARDVERAHRLPAAVRQARVLVAGRLAYLDNLYEAARLAVELDGQAGHGLEHRWLDAHRDNSHATHGILTLRYSWADVTGQPCTVARQVAQILTLRGTPVRPRPCSPACPVAAERAS